jgi:hypothetical protein
LYLSKTFEHPASKIIRMPAQKRDRLHLINTSFESSPLRGEVRVRGQIMGKDS